MANCKYTFRRKGQWFIRDLLAGKKMPFALERMTE